MGSVDSRTGTPAYSASGFFFRSSQSLEAPQGPDYWIMLYPVQNRLVFSQMNAANAEEDGTDKWIKLGEKDLPFDVVYGQVYSIKVVAMADYTYTVSISNNDEWYTIYGSFSKATLAATDLRFGSIGLRTLNVPSTFYSVNYVPLVPSALLEYNFAQNLDNSNCPNTGYAASSDFDLDITQQIENEWASIESFGECQELWGRRRHKVSTYDSTKRVDGRPIPGMELELNSIIYFDPNGIDPELG